ncbi:MAG: zinc carboxypeptidase, partial [bacterium]|nr:zinc carboxypeptidase [bacterium]
ALSLAESAADPSHPVSPTGLTAEDVRHTPVATSMGANQVIEVLARKNLTLGLSYTINGGEAVTANFSQHLGAAYNQAAGVYYSNYRAVISGQAAGDAVSYTITAGDNTLGPYAYTAASATGARVLIISAEDYTGEYPEYADPSGPNYLGYYTDALDAAGYAYDVWDVTAHEAVPSPIDVLTHYDVAVWYTGDDYAPTVPGLEIHQQQYLTLREFMNYDAGKLLATGQDLSYLSAVTGDFSDDFFQYTMGSFIHVEEGGMDGDAGTPFPVSGESGDPIFDGLTFNLFGGDGAGNQCCADSFLLTSYFLPHFDHAIAAKYDRPGGPFDPHSGVYYVYSQMADISYKRLGGTFTLPDGAPTIKFWISYNLETDWDYAFVEINEVGADAWTTLPDQNGLTAQGTGDSCADGWVDEIHPFLARYMDADCNPSGTTGEWHAFNGNSNGWKQVEMDLTAYAGKTVEIHITSASDWGTQNLGVFIDDIEVSGYSLEDFETGMGPFSVSVAPDSIALNNWTRMEGTSFPEGAAIVSPNSLYLGFGFESVDTAANRAEIMNRVMQYFMP